MEPLDPEVAMRMARMKRRQQQAAGDVSEGVYHTRKAQQREEYDDPLPFAEQDMDEGYGTAMDNDPEDMEYESVVGAIQPPMMEPMFRSKASRPAPPPRPARFYPAKTRSKPGDLIGPHVPTRIRSMRPMVPPTSLAQRIKYKLTQKAAGLASAYVDELNRPPKWHLTQMVRTKEGTMTRQESELRKLKKEIGDFRWEVQQDGLYHFLEALPTDKAHYSTSKEREELLNTQQARIRYANKSNPPQMAQKPTLSTSVTRRYVGSSYGGEYGNVLY